MTSSVFSAVCSGIYRIPADGTALRVAVRKSGMFWITLDLSGVSDRRVLTDRIARELRYPGTFGGNWDALADCLQDLSWLQEKGWLMQLSGMADIAGPAWDARLLDILNAAADYWRQRGRVFIVLVDGNIDLPELAVP